MVTTGGKAALVFTDRGGLLVAEQPVDALDRRELDRIQHTLSQLDERLRLRIHVRQDGRPVWTVQEHVGERASLDGYMTVLYWTDDHGEPKPLTWAIVDRVKQLEGNNPFRQAMLANEQVVATARRNLREAGEEAAGDIEPRLKETRSAALHRSQGLRRSRDRRRARGENV